MHIPTGNVQTWLCNYKLVKNMQSCAKLLSHPLFLNIMLPTRPDLMCCLGFQSVSWLFVHSVAVQSLLSLLTLTYESFRHKKGRLTPGMNLCCCLHTTDNWATFKLIRMSCFMAYTVHFRVLLARFKPINLLNLLFPSFPGNHEEMRGSWRRLHIAVHMSRTTTVTV